MPYFEAQQQSCYLSPSNSGCCAAVWQALQRGDTKIPYGNSCLTRLLADSMGAGTSRSTLIATCRCCSVHAGDLPQHRQP